MRDRQHRTRRNPIRALAGTVGGVLIVLMAAAAPALAAPATPPSTTPTATPAATTSAPTAQPSLGIGPAISTSRRPPTSTLGRLGVEAASDSASQVRAATSAPAPLPTGVNAGHGARGRVPAISEFGGAAALVLLVAGLLGYRRRAGTHRG
jgi:hypothetical protein